MSQPDKRVLVGGPFPQGVALGYHVTAFQAEEKLKKKAPNSMFSTQEDLS
jgi:hypothetical protein